MSSAEKFTKHAKRYTCIFSERTAWDGEWCVFRMVDLSLAIAVKGWTACATSGRPIVDAEPS